MRQSQDALFVDDSRREGMDLSEYQGGIVSALRSALLTVIGALPRQAPKHVS